MCIIKNNLDDGAGFVVSGYWIILFIIYITEVYRLDAQRKDLVLTCITNLMLFFGLGNI